MRFLKKFLVPGMIASFMSIHLWFFLNYDRYSIALTRRVRVGMGFPRNTTPAAKMLDCLEMHSTPPKEPAANGSGVDPAVPTILPFIQLCVLSLSRPNVSYVHDVLGSLRQAVDSTSGIGVKVLDLSPEVHREDMLLARRRFPEFGSQTVRNRSLVSCSTGCSESVNWSIPCCVQQQSLDVATGLELCAPDTHPNGTEGGGGRGGEEERERE